MQNDKNDNYRLGKERTESERAGHEKTEKEDDKVYFSGGFKFNGMFLYAESSSERDALLGRKCQYEL